MKNKIGIKYKELFIKCQGNCQECGEGLNCQLQKMIKKYGLSLIKSLVYNEYKKKEVDNTSIKRGRGRPRKIRVSSEQTLKEAKKILGKGVHRGIVYIKCLRCKEEIKIYANDKEIYTNKVRKHFVCITCKGALR